MSANTPRQLLIQNTYQYIQTNPIQIPNPSNMSIIKMEHGSDSKRNNPTHQTSPLQWDNLPCELHPQFKIDAVCVNEQEKELKLFCIKCIIDGLNRPGEKMIPMKEMMEQCCTKLQNTEGRQKVEKKHQIEELFLNFLTKDYVSNYEQQLHSQFKKVDMEFKEVIQSLNDLKDKIKTFFQQDVQEVKKKGDEVKSRIKKYLETRDPVEDSKIDPKDVQAMLEKVNSKEDLNEILSALYFKSHKTMDIEDFDSEETLEMMESLKNRAFRVKENEIDFDSIQEMSRLVQMMLKSPHFPSFKQRPMFPLYEYKKVTPQSSGKPSVTKESPSTMYETPSTLVKRGYMESSDMIRDTTEKKKKVRILDLESNSLRNLKKEFDSKALESDTVKNQAIGCLSDWINRRLTGYLIFQNTMGCNNEKSQLKGMGVHLNSIAGKKWKELPENERAEYNELAKRHRKEFRTEIENYENYENYDDLIEKLDHKIKKLKKE